MTEPQSNSPGADGYTVGYAAAKGSFRVYICFALAAILLAVWFYSSQSVVLVLSAFFAATAYYFYPLIETGKVRLGAGEYGVFVEGFGIIPWRSIDDVRLSTYAVRSIIVNEIHIKLAKSLPQALAADWRSLPYYRLLMKQPWSMSADNVVRINLEPFSGRPEDIVGAIRRNRRFFGGQ